MKTIYAYSFICLTSLFIIACNASKKENVKTFEKLEQTNWLIGTWENASDEGLLTEHWKKENDSMYFGESYLIIGEDTVFSEKITLMQDQKELYYIPTVNNQNDGKPVKFKLSSCSEKQLVFVNPKHDFPQKIEYRLITNDSLVAEISGKVDGKTKAETFPMKRMKKK